jgi:hypothetical protein
MPSAMADEAPSSATAKDSTIFVPVRTVDPTRPVEFGAGLYVLMGILVIPLRSVWALWRNQILGSLYLYRLGLSLNDCAI